jgi:uncharacterized protein (TIGR02145 family)
MKKFTFILIALLSVIMAKSQIINVCGTDTIILEVENYDNKGTIEWQESIDSINWVTIPEIAGETFKFFPVESKYYRSVVKTSICDPLYSTIAYVQLPPVANAGTDKVVGGTKTLLMGNIKSGDVGEWSILSGEGGVIAEYNNPHSVFDGLVDQEYQIIWTLTNACGQSSDTVLIRFEELVLNTNIIVIDNTDSIYSDSTEMANGHFRIKFSDPEIIPYDSVLLLGIRSDQYFFQRVISYTYNDSIFSFNTVQATLEDYLLQGRFNIGDAVNSYFLSQVSVNQPVKVKAIKSFPLRKDIIENIKNNGVLVIEPFFSTSSKVISNTFNDANKEATVNFHLSDFKFKLLDELLQITLESFKFSLSPNFVCDLDIIRMYMRYGLVNAKLNTNLQYKIEIKGDTSLVKDTIAEYEKTIVPIPFLVGAIPVVLNIDLVAGFKPKVGLGFTFNHSYNYSNTITAIVQKNLYDKPNYYYDANPITTSELATSVNIGLDFETYIGIQCSFTIFKFLKPYIKLPVNIEFDLKTSTERNWSSNLDFGVKGNIGVKSDKSSKVLPKFLAFDLYYEFLNKSFYKLTLPYRLENLSGSMQIGRENEMLLKPIVFRVVSNKGTGVPFVRIYFELEDGHGSVNQVVVITDITGQGTVYWTSGNQGVNYLRASVYDYENRHIANSPLYVAAFTKEDYPCENSNLTIIMKKDNQMIYPHVQGGYPPYTYSKDGITYNNYIPEFSVDLPGNYKVYAKDQNNCVTVRTFKIDSISPCDNSTLIVELSSEGNIVKANGKWGKEPYQYSLNNLNDFSEINTFLNLSVGQHTIYVKDSNGCIASSVIIINETEQKAIKAIYPIDKASNIPVKNITLSWATGNYAPNQSYSVNLRKENEPPFGPPEFDLVSPSYTIPIELDYGSTYFWEVRVYNQNGQYMDSHEFSFTTTDSSNTTPEMPIVYYPEDNLTTQSLPQWFVWGKQYGNFVYDLYLDNNNATRRIANNIEDTTFIVNSLVENQRYYWKVVVKNKFTGEFKVSPIYSFILNKIGEVFNAITGKTWMDRNLGASRVATSSTDSDAYGDLYQWGRGTDGHQKRNSLTTSTRSSSDSPGHDKFITASNSPYDWRSPQNNNLWQGVSGTNNPCPVGFRIPALAEWQAELNSWSNKNSAGAFASPLKLPVAGYRSYSGGSLSNVGYDVLYWSSTVDGANAQSLNFHSINASTGSGFRAHGSSVRCIKDCISISLPTLTTSAISGVTINSASSGGDISSDGGASITSRGIVWSTTQNPTVSLTTKTDDGTGTGSFISSITGLIINNTYYVRAYATNALGTAYGDQLSFTTSTTSTDSTVYNPATGKTWMDRNLGASRVANSSTDSEAYGDLYQWGRGTDGHEKRTSLTTSTLSTSDTSGHNKFITVSSGNYDWRSPQNNNLWQGVNGINNPCPEGYRLPTITEWEAERASWGSSNLAGAFASPLKLTVAGRRYQSGTLSFVGSGANYWSATVGGTHAYFLEFRNNAGTYADFRVCGFSVRCLKD